MAAPGVIKKLDETLVNRIAAGEVVQRPVNALKELLENSLDANATDIVIRVQYGSIKFLQIQDNGTGIRKEDLEILCERFTTSKLSQFSDLNTISTFGFRGEALASISHVAHLTVLTKTADSVCAYIARYTDGKLIKPPTPIAGNQGTQITVEDLFFNLPARRQALKNTNEEYYRILDMVSSYAIHNPHVGFSIKKQGDPIAVLRTPCSSNHMDNIKELHGFKVSKDLLEINYSDEGLRFVLNGYVTNVNYSSKKPIFLLFINNRLVDSPGLRKALDSVYSLYLPKGSYPFVYLSLQLDPRIVDVNVHPTKHEVHFLHEDRITDKVRLAVDVQLSNANSSRALPTQIRPAGSVIVQQSVTNSSGNPSHMVRTDANVQKIDKFFSPNVSQASSSESMACDESVEPSAKKMKLRDIKLSSVKNLREEIIADCNELARDLFLHHVFVGCVNKSLSLIQYKEVLYMCNTEKLMEEFFYQIMILSFGNFGEIGFNENVPLISLLSIALECPQCTLTNNAEKDSFAFRAVEFLQSKSPMLYDYFSMKIDDGNLVKMPYILEDYEPDFGGLPIYIYNLVTEVNWEDEKECFRTFCRVTAKFFSKIGSKSKNGNEDWKWVMEHVVFSNARKSFRPPNLVAESSIIQIANVPELYKVFERC